MQLLSGRIRRFGFEVAISGRIFVRCYGNKLFVGGLSYDTNETILWNAFQQYGSIIEVKIICDRLRERKSKGYGFLHFDTEKAAAEALQQMDGQLLDGRNIRLEYAREKTNNNNELERDSN